MGHRNTSFKSDLESGGVSREEKMASTSTNTRVSEETELEHLQPPQGAITYTRKYEVVRYAHR